MKKGIDYYVENGQTILTEDYLRRRGHCCGSGCRHCPFARQKGSEYWATETNMSNDTQVTDYFLKMISGWEPIPTVKDVAILVLFGKTVSLGIPDD